MPKQAGDVRAGGAYVEIGEDLTPLIRGLQTGLRKIQSFARQARRIGLGIMTAGGAIAAPIAQATRTFASYGDTIAKAARRTGFSNRTMSELAHVAGLAGSGLQSVEKATRGMARALFDAERNSTEMVYAFEQLGLSWKQLKGLNPETQFLTIMERLRAVQDPTLKAALAMRIFGRSGSELIPMLDMSAQAFAAARMETHLLGIAFTGETGAAAENLTDQFARLRGSIKGFSIIIGSTLAGALSKLIDKVVVYLAAGRMWLAQNPQIITGVTKLAATLLGVGAALVGVATALLVLTNPIGAVVVALGGVTVAVLTVLDSLGLVDVGIGRLAKHFKIAGTTAKAWIDLGVGMMQSAVIEFHAWLIGGVESVFNAIRGVVADAVGFIVKAMDKVGIISGEKAGEWLAEIETQRTRGTDVDDELRREANRVRMAAALGFMEATAEAGGKASFSDLLDRAKELQDQIKRQMEMPGFEAPSLTGTISSMPAGGVVGMFGGAGFLERLGFLGTRGTAEKQLDVLEEINEGVGTVARNTQSMGAVYG